MLVQTYIFAIDGKFDPSFSLTIFHGHNQIDMLGFEPCTDISRHPCKLILQSKGGTEVSISSSLSCGLRTCSMQMTHRTAFVPDRLLERRLLPHDLPSSGTDMPLDAQCAQKIGDAEMNAENILKLHLFPLYHCFIISRLSCIIKLCSSPQQLVERDGGWCGIACWGLMGYQIAYDHQLAKLLAAQDHSLLLAGKLCLKPCTQTGAEDRMLGEKGSLLPVSKRAGHAAGPSLVLKMDRHRHPR